MYILLCSNGQYYVGSTKYLSRRIHQHQSGQGAKFTKRFSPVRLVYFEEFDRIDHAFDREQQIQRWTHIKKRALVDGEISKLKALANPRKRISATRSDFGSGDQL